MMILEKAKAVGEKIRTSLTDDQKYLVRYLTEGALGFLSGVALNATLLAPGGKYDKAKYLTRYLTEGAVGFSIGKLLNRTILKPSGDGTMVSGEDPLLNRGQEILRNG